MLGKKLIDKLRGVGQQALRNVRAFAAKLRPKEKLINSPITRAVGKILLNAGRKITDASDDLQNAGVTSTKLEAETLLDELSDIKRAENIYRNMSIFDDVLDEAIIERKLKQPYRYKVIIRRPAGFTITGERQYDYFSGYTNEIGTVQDAISEIFSRRETWDSEVMGGLEDYELAMVFHNEGASYKRSDG